MAWRNVLGASSESIKVTSKTFLFRLTRNVTIFWDEVCLRRLRAEAIMEMNGANGIESVRKLSVKGFNGRFYWLIITFWQEHAGNVNKILSFIGKQHESSLVTHSSFLFAFMLSCRNNFHRMEWVREHFLWINISRSLTSDAVATGLCIRFEFNLRFFPSAGRREKLLHMLALNTSAVWLFVEQIELNLEILHRTVITCGRTWT